ncbi:MAG: amidohydrolase family protein [Firmicutes bacterium]|nr:amidohydrolase family protein [Bacillota bacterium]
MFCCKKTDLDIWNGELKDFVPDTIFDFHCHIWLCDHMRGGWSIESSSPSLPFTCAEFPVERLTGAESILFPGKRVTMLMFGLPRKEVDIARNNEYVSSSSRKVNGYGLMIPPLDASSDELDAMISRGSFVGFKPYWTFVTWKEQNEVRIDDMVTEAQLEVANARKLIILLHIPRELRLADPDNLDSIKRMARRYPNARLVIAHVGRSYCTWPAKEGLGQLKDLENVYFDTAMVQNPVVYQLLFRKVSLERILFGTDLPIAWEKGRVVCVNERNLFVTAKPYPWSLSAPGEKALECTYFAYESLRAIKEAAELEDLSPTQLKPIFYDNAKRIVEDVAK